MINDDLLNVLYECHGTRVSVSSDFARANAPAIAMAASKSLISTKLYTNVYGREWRLTTGGLTVLNEYELEEHPNAD